MPTSVRLDPDTERLLRQLARAAGRSKSDIIRDALRFFAEQSSVREAGPGGAYARMADLVGSVDSGDPDLARRHRSAFREALKAKHKR